MAKNIIVIEGINIAVNTVYYTVPVGKIARIYILWSRIGGNGVLMGVSHNIDSSGNVRQFANISYQGSTTQQNPSALQDFLSVYKGDSTDYLYENGHIATSNSNLVGLGNYTGRYAFMIIEEDLGVQQ